MCHRVLVLYMPLKICKKYSEKSSMIAYIYIYRVGQKSPLAWKEYETSLPLE